MGQNGARWRNAAKAQNLDAIKRMWPMIVRVFVGAGILIGILLAATAAAAGWVFGMVE